MSLKAKAQAWKAYEEATAQSKKAYDEAAKDEESLNQVS